MRWRRSVAHHSGDQPSQPMRSRLRWRRAAPRRGSRAAVGAAAWRTRACQGWPAARSSSEAGSSSRWQSYHAPRRGRRSRRFISSVSRRVSWKRTTRAAAMRAAQRGCAAATAKKRAAMPAAKRSTTGRNHPTLRSQRAASRSRSLPSERSERKRGVSGVAGVAGAGGAAGAAGLEGAAGSEGAAGTGELAGAEALAGAFAAGAVSRVAGAADLTLGAEVFAAGAVSRADRAGADGRMVGVGSWAADLAAGAGVGSVSGAADMSGVGLFMAYLTTSSCSRRWSTTILSMMVFTRMSISDPSV